MTPTTMHFAKAQLLSKEIAGERSCPDFYNCNYTWYDDRFEVGDTVTVWMIAPSDGGLMGPLMFSGSGTEKLELA